jgi:hypothetical protein
LRAHEGFQFHLLLGNNAQFGIAPHHLSSACGPGPGERAFRAAPQRCNRGPVIGTKCQSSADGQSNFCLTHYQWLAERLHQLREHEFGWPTAPEAGENQRKPISSCSRYQIRRSSLGAKDLGHLLQAFVSNPDSVRIVDPFEAVEIEADNSELLIPIQRASHPYPERERTFQLFLKECAIGQASEAVVAGVMQYLPLQFLPLAYIDAQNKSRRHAAEHNAVCRDIHGENRAIFADVTRCAVGAGRRQGDLPQDLRHLALVDNIGKPELCKLFARIPMCQTGGLVHSQKLKCFHVVDPKRMRICIECQTVLLRGLSNRA